MSLLDVDPACVAAAEGEPARDDARARVPLFRRPLVDRLMTRTPPWLPALVYTPLVVALLVEHADAGALLIVSATLCGVLLWSLIEYALHRFGLHLPQHSRSWRVAYFLVHGHHHGQPRDAERLVATLPQSALLLALVYGLASLVSALSGLDRRYGSAPVAALLAGTTLGYLLYEAAHYAIHHVRSRRGPLRLIARHHLAHHADPTSRYGISTPLWDHVFRTLPRRRATSAATGTPPPG